MAEIFILDRNGAMNKSRPPALKGKAGRLFRSREKAKKLTALWNATVEQLSRVDMAVSSVSMRPVELVDVANYRCNKGKSTINSVRATQKRRLSHRDLV